MEDYIKIAADSPQAQKFLAFNRQEKQRIQNEILGHQKAISVLTNELYEVSNTIKDIEPLVLAAHKLPPAKTMSDILTPPLSLQLEYQIKWVWWERAKFILSKTLFAMTAKEVFDKIYQFDKELQNMGYDTAYEKNFAALANALGTNVGKHFNRYKKGVGDYYYGLINWFDAQGNIKIEHDTTL